MPSPLDHQQEVYNIQNYITVGLHKQLRIVILFFKMGKTLVKISLWVLGFGMFSAFGFRSCTNKCLHAHFALHSESEFEILIIWQCTPINI